MNPSQPVFEISLSLNGLIWENVLKVPGAGNSIQEQAYTADISSWMNSNDIYYVRLTQVDYDGTREEFPFISAHCAEGKSNSIKLFPNPGSDFVSVFSELPSSAIRVVNSCGQIVKILELEVPTTQVQLDFSTKASGVYFIQVTDFEGVVTVIKFTRL